MPLRIPTEEVLGTLIENRVSESETLDFKRDALTLANVKAKRSFLKDVTAMANRSGGLILYGVAEEDGTAVAQKVMPLPEWTDKERLTAQQVLHDCTEPRLLTARFESIPVSGGFVWCVAVEPSMVGPHAVFFEGARSFQQRVGPQNTPMDVFDLRRAFTASLSFSERVEAMRVDRAAATAAGQLPYMVPQGPRMLLQVVSGATWTGAPLIDPRDVKRLQVPVASAPLENEVIKRMNADGFFAWMPNFAATDRQTASNYVQVFRDGRYELSLALSVFTDPQDARIYLGQVDRRLVEACAAAFTVLTALDACTPPLAVAVSLVSVKGLRFSYDGTFDGGTSDLFFDRDTVLLPIHVLDEAPVGYERAANSLTGLRDALYQSIGLDGITGARRA